MQYRYQGLDAAGAARKGKLEATGNREARQKLRADGIYVTELKEEHKAGSQTGMAIFKRRIPAKEKASLLRQLASLLKAGIPLMESLIGVEKQAGSDVLRKAIHQMREEVRKGEPLATAMERSGGHFDLLTVATVRAGEAGGNLAVALGRLATYMEIALKRESNLRSALSYPLVVGFVGAGAIIFLIAYIVPKVTSIFEDLNQALPLSTEILLAVTELVTSWGHIIGVCLLAVFWLVYKWSKKDKGSRIIDRLLINLWIVGPVVRSAILARWSHTTSILLASGVPLLQTLKLARQVAGNVIYGDALDEAAEQIREGAGIAISLDKSGLFPPVTIQMVAAGEKSGQSAELLEQVAEDQTTELESRITILLSMIQPLLILLLGGAVMFIVMAILLPILEISQFIG